MKVTQLCPPLCYPMDYTVHGILQDRILEWVAISFFRGSSWPRDWNQVSRIAGGFFYQLSQQGSPRILEWVAYHSPADLPDPGIKPGSPALQVDSLPVELPGKPKSKGDHNDCCLESLLWRYKETGCQL